MMDVQRNRSAKRMIFLTIFMDLLGFGMIIPILGPISTNYVPAKLHGQGAALLMVAFSLLQMLFSPLWGKLSDRHGRRPILLLSLAGSTLSYVLFALSHNYAMLLLSRVLAGISGANITAAQAYISDITSPKERTAGMGLVGMAFGLGFVFGPVIGGGATRIWHVFMPTAPVHMGPGFVAAAICGLNLVWAFFRLPESLPPERRGHVHFRRFASTREALANLSHPSLGPLIILFFLVTFAFANLEVSFSIYARTQLGLNEEHIFGLFVYIGFVMAFIQGFVVRRAVRFVPEQMMMIVGVATLTVGLFLLPIIGRVAYVLFVMTILSSGQGIAMPAILSLISRTSSAQSQGNVFGTNQALASLARIVGPAFGGIIFDVIGPRWPFWAAAAIMACAIAWAVHARDRLLAYPPPLTPGADAPSVS